MMRRARVLVLATAVLSYVVVNARKLEHESKASRKYGNLYSGKLLIILRRTRCTLAQYSYSRYMR